MKRRRFRNRALFTVVLAAALYAGALIYLHPRFLYPFREDPFRAPGYATVMVPVPDTTPVEVQVSQGADDAPVVLYFMGNVGALAYFRPMLDHHTRAGRSVIAMTYRGAGGVAGMSTETTLKRDALAVADHVKQRFGDRPLFVHGYSLGTGLAVHVAARREVQGVILSAPYDAICRLMTRRSGLPACYLPVQRWRTDRDLAGLKAPVLIQHGTADRVVPYVNGTRLAGLMQEAGIPLTFVALPGSGHGNLMNYPDHQHQIDRFIAARQGR